MRAVLLAIFVYAAGSSAAAAEDGKYLYILHCSGCHGPQGKGSMEGRIPALAGSVGHFMKLPQARNFLPQAPGVMNSGLKDEQVTALMNWLVPNLAGSSLSPPYTPYTVEEIAHSRATRPADFFAARRKIAADLEAIGAGVSPY